jgi:VanZ family protein
MTETIPIRSANRSTFARAGLAIYALLIVYASWYPFSGWHNNGLSLFAWLSSPLPHYWTLFDLATNVIGYLPFGLLMVFALHPRVTGLPAILLTLVAGALLSGAMEAVQTYLPSRVPSNLDLMTNAAGALIGAIAGVLLSRAFLQQSPMLALRRDWFTPEAGRGLIVLGLWPLAQIYPQSYLFGHGQITPIVSGWLTDWLSTPIDLGALIRHEAELSIEQYWLSETIIAACGLTGAVLTLLCLSQAKAPRAALAMLFVVAAVAVKAMASALLFTPENAFAWLTPGAQGGLLIGAIMLTGLALAPPVAQRRVAALALITSLAAVNAVPANPYFVATLQAWVQGKFLNFNGAAQFLSLLWPFFALWFLYHPAHRVKQN